MSVYKLKQAVLLVGAITLLLIAPVISLPKTPIRPRTSPRRLSVSAPEDSHAVKLTRDGKCENLC
jgi:hypothetical protein